MANIQAVNGAGLGPVVTSVNGEVGDVDVSGASIPDASETVKGIVELATDAETATATATDKATTPANVAFAYLKLAGGTLTGALVGTTITAATALRAGAASWAQTGAIRLASLGSINWRNAADTGDIGGFSSNASDQVQVASDFVPSTDGTKALGSTSVRWASLRSVFAALGTNPASTGSLRLGSTGGINWRNAANTADLGGFSSNASDQLTVATTLVPATDNTKDLGTGALRWASIAAAGEILGKDFSAVGLTGAVTATRYVGGTASVAPTTGTFITGDYVIAVDGKVWICTAGGTPGTWVEAGSATYQPLDADLTTLATPGSAGQVPVSNGSAIAWGAAGGTTIPHTAQTADYTLALADAGTVVEMNKATAVTVTIPLNATVAFPVDTTISIQQMGAGTVTVAATGGVTIDGGSVFTVAQYGVIVLRKRATDEWVVAANAGSAIQVGELGYAAITADVTQVGAGNALVTGMSSTVTTTSRPVMVTMSTQIKHGTSGSTIALTLEEDGTQILSAEFTAAAANQSVPVERSIRRFPTAGSHTYRCRVTTTGTGTGTVMASPTSPAWVNVIQV